jgi:HK97 family phage prohead protease
MDNHPCDNLIRATAPVAAPFEVRATDDGDGSTLTGHFSVFDNWYEIDSWLEGRFLERIRPGAFARAFSEQRDRVKVLFDHGYDPQIGNKVLGSIDDMAEDKTGARYDVSLFTDATYVADLMPGLRAGVYGSSFRFKVTGEEWVEPARSTKHNPEKLPERSITDVDLYEFGPVTFPANPEATAGVRSLTDSFVDRLMTDPRFVARFTERTGPAVVSKILAGLPDDVRTSAPAADGPTAPATRTVAQIRAQAYAAGLLR